MVWKMDFSLHFHIYNIITLLFLFYFFIKQTNKFIKTTVVCVLSVFMCVLYAAIHLFLHEFWDMRFKKMLNKMHINFKNVQKNICALLRWLHFNELSPP